jgi:hypothetical protein
MVKLEKQFICRGGGINIRVKRKIFSPRNEDILLSCTKLGPNG